ncbi:uncharacterized protein K460DRAFT_417383 [Cucurbitaria berberidis CBS 394.84]|uniref:DUF7053 domain-containing protein n=1 Tax=Cucurbitaria berberidis CBS 394.84 TaxID=1168544 RepID=A0A9P4GJB9_9PLEO|nr:uncharacterized protein K460DRAFT_417383 [Cucurbitaria berberidis CBS 394.84]KAF1846264.1 hypothetical protein K460DRAFT_417383 [Cucurbitaria berberidis CBS 394.84]
MPTSHISTPIGAVDAAVVITALHNHDLMIRTLCPALVSYTFEAGYRNTQATYCITDRTPGGQTAYNLTLTNVPSGVNSLVNAKPPVGVLTISGKWRVAGGELVEEVEIDANFMMKKVAKSNVEKTHPEQHMKLLHAALA